MDNPKQKLNRTFMELLYSIRKYHFLMYKNCGPLSDTSHGQGRILAILKLKSEMTAKDLSYLLGIRQQSLNETLKKLEKDGYITRTPSPKDGRVMLISLTNKGRKVKQVTENNSNILDGFSNEELAQFAKYLNQLRQSYDQKIKELANPEEEKKFDEFHDRMTKMREKLGDEEFSKMMKNDNPFSRMFNRPF